MFANSFGYYMTVGLQERTTTTTHFWYNFAKKPGELITWTISCVGLPPRCRQLMTKYHCLHSTPDRWFLSVKNREAKIAFALFLRDFDTRRRQSRMSAALEHPGAKLSASPPSTLCHCASRFRACAYVLLNVPGSSLDLTIDLYQ